MLHVTLVSILASSRGQVPEHWTIAIKAMALLEFRSCEWAST